MEQDNVEITYDEYMTLKRRDDFLTALEMAGVDNWQGIEDAYDIYEEMILDKGV